MGKIVFPNTDPLLDPAFASHEAQRCLPDQIALLQELRDHLRDLIKRAFGQHKDSVHDLVVIGGLSKQALVALDGLCICLEAGAAHAGHIQARAQWEATLFVEWILQNGRERWGRQYYVADIRRERNSTRRAIIGTPENAAYQELWRETYEKEPNEFSEEFVKKASEHLAEIDRILAIADRHGLLVVQDCACSFGSRFRGRMVGGLAPISVFSLHARKVVTTGDVV